MTSQLKYGVVFLALFGVLDVRGAILFRTGNVFGEGGRFGDAHAGFSRGIPRSSGTVVAVSSGRRIGVWSFADPSAPRHLKTYSLTDGSEPVSFWKGRIVVPGFSAGVLMSENSFGK